MALRKEKKSDATHLVLVHPHPVAEEARALRDLPSRAEAATTAASARSGPKKAKPRTWYSCIRTPSPRKPGLCVTCPARNERAPF